MSGWVDFGAEADELSFPAPNTAPQEGTAASIAPFAFGSATFLSTPGPSPTTNPFQVLQPIPFAKQSSGNPFATLPTSSSTSNGPFAALSSRLQDASSLTSAGHNPFDGTQIPPALAASSTGNNPFANTPPTTSKAQSALQGAAASAKGKSASPGGDVGRPQASLLPEELASCPAPPSHQGSASRTPPPPPPVHKLLQRSPSVTLQNVDPFVDLGVSPGAAVSQPMTSRRAPPPARPPPRPPPSRPPLPSLLQPPPLMHHPQYPAPGPVSSTDLDDFANLANLKATKAAITVAPAATAPAALFVAASSRSQHPHPSVSPNLLFGDPFLGSAAQSPLQPAQSSPNLSLFPDVAITSAVDEFPPRHWPPPPRPQPPSYMHSYSAPSAFALANSSTSCDSTAGANLSSLGKLHPSGSSTQLGELETPDNQLCVDVRMPPLQPEFSLTLTLLAGGCCCLFALVGGAGTAMLQWSNADKGLLVPVGCSRALQEDPDAGQSGEVPMPGDVSGRILCVCVDDLAGLLWTGHESGQVCQWSFAKGRAALYEQHWQAHQTGKVLGLAVTAWGDVWTASSTGNVCMWAIPAKRRFDPPRPPVRVAVSARPQLKLNKVAVSTTGAHARATHLAASTTGRVVWSSGTRSINLWAAHDGEYLGSIRANRSQDEVFRDAEEMSFIDVKEGLHPAAVAAQFKSRCVLYQTLAEGAEAEAIQAGKPAALFNAAAKFAAKLQQKEAVRAQVNPGLAAAQVRGSIKAMASTLDGGILVAYKYGLVEKFTELGRLLWSASLQPGVTSVASVGYTIWLGCLDGRIKVLELSSGEVVRDWPAHHFPVASLARVGSLVYSLCLNGSIRGWGVVAPAEPEIRAWQESLQSVLRHHKLRILVGTWNVNASRPSPQSLRVWVGERAQQGRADIVIVALQEVEIGAGSVAVDAAYAYLFQQKLREKGNHNAKWWTQELLDALGPEQYTRVALRQMSGMLLLVYCKQKLSKSIGEVVTSSVACGVMGVGGNKGGVAISMSVFRRRVVAVCSHFAAHLMKVDERNADHAKILRNLNFANTAQMLQQVTEAAQESGKDKVMPTVDGDMMVVRPDGQVDFVATDDPPRQGDMEAALDELRAGSDDDNDAGAAGVAAVLSVQRIKDAAARSAATGSDSGEDFDSRPSGAELRAGGEGFGSGRSRSSVGTGSGTLGRPAAVALPPARPATGPALPDAALLIWSGDFNYRIEGEYDHVVHLIHKQRLRELLEHDQCRREMSKGNIFPGLSEGPITFPPTYKFDKNVAVCEASGMLPYDSSEKRRVPAWTDRIFFRGTLPGSTSQEEQVHVGLRGPEAYNTVLDVCDSDHKPVFAELDVVLPAYAQDQRRRMCFKVLSAKAEQQAPATAASGTAGAHKLVLSRQSLVLQAGAFKQHTVQVTNQSLVPQVMMLGGNGATTWHVPTWLEVTPVTALLAPGKKLDLTLRAVQPEAPAASQHCSHRVQQDPSRRLAGSLLAEIAC